MRVVDGEGAKTSQRRDRGKENGRKKTDRRVRIYSTWLLTFKEERLKETEKPERESKRRG